jgi:glyoxylase-like metal-dependent hydrolase (beta-lactamase superfamily II)
MTDWTELGDRCWVRRHPDWDLNVGVVAGTDGVLVIDTRENADQATELLEAVRRVAPGPVRWVVNTHAHFDHVCGNSVLAAAGATIYAHEVAAAAFPEGVPVDQTFASVKVIDLGDRRVELLHLGKGHTGGDVVVVVPDVDVVFAGDMIEESAPPSYGDDSYPLEWSDTVDRLAGLLSATARVVPGHGAVVDREFVQAQGADLGTVANAISGLHHNGASLDEALAHDDWPYPKEGLEQAVRRGYEHLGGVHKNLPMI